MSFQEVLNLILALFGIASTLGVVASVFWGARNRTVITTLKESNEAYKERNGQLEQTIIDLQKELNELSGKVDTLTKLKTPSYEPLVELINANHKDMMKLMKQVSNG